MYWDSGMHMGWMGLWWLLGAALVGAFVWALVRSARSSSGDESGQSPEKIIKQRYARGEIDRETYQRMRSDLRG